MPGLLVGEGYFGGDRRYPRVTLKMHIRHKPIFEWLARKFGFCTINGPYHHVGRSYDMMHWRGTALKYELMPLLEALPWMEFDTHSWTRYQNMKRTYGPEDVAPEILCKL